MKYSSAFLALVASTLTGLTSAQTTSTATFDVSYDNPNGNTGALACSNLGGKFPTFGSLPGFPNIGGAPFLANAPNSPLCGTCWKLQYEDPAKGSQEIFVIAVDAAGAGWVISKEALIKLAGQEGVDKGKVDITFTEVDGWFCGAH